MDQQQLVEQFGPREAMEYDVVIVGGGPPASPRPSA
jgi:electron-transferring-flavoprotein dehydrogenase